jgi:CHASE2 domain-containing sensor protein
MKNSITKNGVIKKRIPARSAKQHPVQLAILHAGTMRSAQLCNGPVRRFNVNSIRQLAGCRSMWDVGGFEGAACSARVGRNAEQFMKFRQWFVDDGTFLGATRSALPTLFLLTALMAALESAGWLDFLQNYALDRVLELNTSRQSDRVVLIPITDADYENPQFFNGTSPLDPRIILEAVDYLAQAHPAAIGIDLDTSDKRYASLPLNAHGVPIVWARGANVANARERPKRSVSQLWKRPPLFVTPLPFLGGKFTQSVRDEELTTEPASGVAMMPADSDHVVRSYLRTFDVKQEGAEPCRVDSLPWALTKAYCQYCVAHPDDPRGIAGPRAEKILAANEAREADEEGQVFNFSYDPGRFRQIAFSDFVEQNRQKLWPRDRSPLQGRVVILGGQFAQARDMHFTPVGERFGLEMVAEAVDGEVEHRFIGHLAIWSASLLELVAGLALVWVHWWLHRPWAVYAMTLLIVVLSIVCSMIAFRTAAYWFNFTAVFVGVWIHLLWDSTQAGRRAHRELAQLLARNPGAGGAKHH